MFYLVNIFFTSLGVNTGVFCIDWFTVQPLMYITGSWYFLHIQIVQLPMKTQEKYCQAIVEDSTVFLLFRNSRCYKPHMKVFWCVVYV